jgi:hypothetical protein
MEHPRFSKGGVKKSWIAIFLVWFLEAKKLPEDDALGVFD